MHRATDATVEAQDLAAAIEQVERGEGPNILARLQQTEPHVARYLEEAAAQLSRAADDRVAGMEHALDRMLILVRAFELGHSRLWWDILPQS